MKIKRQAVLKKSKGVDVDEYMANLEHPLKNEIEELRSIIKGADTKISERVKWNAPSYYYLEDLVTFNCRSTMQVHLVFHHVAILEVKSPLLLGEYKDRRMMYFLNMGAVNERREALQNIMRELVAIMDKNNSERIKAGSKSN